MHVQLVMQYLQSVLKQFSVSSAKYSVCAYWSKCNNFRAQLVSTFGTLNGPGYKTRHTPVNALPNLYIQIIIAIIVVIIIFIIFINDNNNNIHNNNNNKIKNNNDPICTFNIFS